MVLCVDEKSQTQALERTGNRDRTVFSNPDMSMNEPVGGAEGGVRR